MNKTGQKSYFTSLRDLSAKWLRRNRTERILLLEAFLFLGIARVGLMIMPFRWLAKMLGEHMKETDTQMQTVELQCARMIGRAVCSAANHTPWRSVCLPQAMAVKWMLKRRRIVGTIYLGVMKDEIKPKKIAAHAWLRCGHIVVSGETGHQQYTVVSTFS